MFSTRGKTATYLIITDNHVMRADVRGQQLLNVTQEDRPIGTTLPIAVELACGLTGKRPAQKTFVVADDFWTGVVDLDERSIYGLSGEELEQMLRYETESMSNLDPSNSRMGFVELSSVPPDTRRFWASGVPSDVLSGVAQAVRVRGGKLQLLANPIGLSSPDRSGVPWVEFTAELAGAFAAPAESGGLPRAYVTRRSATSDRWYEALETLFGGVLPEIGWQGTPEDRPDLFTGSLEALSDESSLKRWIEGVVERTTKPTGFPYIAAPQTQTSSRVIAGVGGVVALLTFLLCGAFAWTLNSEVSSMRSKIAEWSVPAIEKQSLDKLVEETNARLEELKGQEPIEAAKREKLRLLLDQRDRFAILLEAVASQSESNLVLDSMMPASSGVVLSGRAIRRDSITGLVQRLEPLVATVGWAVRPASVTGANQTTAGGPWTFTIELAEQVAKRQPETMTDPVPNQYASSPTKGDD